MKSLHLSAGALGLTALIGIAYIATKPSRYLNPHDPVRTSIEEPTKNEERLEDILAKERFPSELDAESRPYLESQPASQSQPTESKLPPEEFLRLLSDPKYIVEKARGPLDLYLRNNVLPLGEGKFPERAKYTHFDDGSEMKVYAKDAVTDEEGNPLRRFAKMTFKSDAGNLELIMGQDRRNNVRIPTSITLQLSTISGERVSVIARPDGKKIEYYGVDGKLISSQKISYQHPETWNGYAELASLVDY